MKEKIPFHQQKKKEKKKINSFTYKTSISVVNTFMNNPVIVSKFGASHRGVLDTRKHHQGCKIGSRMLIFEQEYLCSDNFFNCTPDNSLFLYRNIFRICDITLYITRHYRYHLIMFVSIKKFDFNFIFESSDNSLHVEKESVEKISSDS